MNTKKKRKSPEIIPDTFKSAAMDLFLLGTQERVRNIRGKRAISVRAIKVLLYLVPSYELTILCTFFA